MSIIMKTTIFFCKIVSSLKLLFYIYLFLIIFFTPKFSPAWIQIYCFLLLSLILDESICIEKSTCTFFSKLLKTIFSRGMHGVLTDYMVKFVPWIHYLWYAISILGFAGLIHFNFNDVGVTKAIQMLWSI